MRFVGRLLIFASAMFFGVWAAGSEATLYLYPAIRELEVSGFDPDGIGVASQSRGIRVIYAGIRSEARDGGMLFLIFFIHNGTDQPISYLGDSANHSFPLLKTDGKELPGSDVCSTASRIYTIPPGRSARIYIDREELPTRLRESAFSEIGFRLRSASGTGSTIYSEPFALPEAFSSSHPFGFEQSTQPLKR